MTTTMIRMNGSARRHRRVRRRAKRCGFLGGSKRGQGRPRSASVLLGFGDKAVSEAANGFDPARLSRVVLELLPEPPDVDVNRSRVDREVVSPDLAQERVAREDDPRVA